MRWDQAQSFFEFDDYIHRRLHTLRPFGYAEFRQAYELDRWDSTARLADPDDLALHITTTSSDSREYLGTRRLVPEGEGGLG